jgi:hypothetical protein
MTPKQNQKESEQNYNIFQRKVKEMHIRKMIIPAQPAAAQRFFPLFMTLIISI